MTEEEGTTAVVVLKANVVVEEDEPEEDGTTDVTALAATEGHARSLIRVTMLVRSISPLYKYFFIDLRT